MIIVKILLWWVFVSITLGPLITWMVFMPQASDEERAVMAKYFGGSGIDDGPPMRYLISQGWKFLQGGMIEKPHAEYEPSQKEWHCAHFLCDEWDYGIK